MTEKVYFKIADHIIEVVAPLNLNLREQLLNFEDFIFTVNEEDQPTITLSIRLSSDVAPIPVEKTTVHSEKSETWGEGFLFEESNSHYITSMKETNGNAKIVMQSSKDFSKSVLYLGDANQAQHHLISWFMMVAFGQGILPYKTVMIHASVVEKNNKEAYAFLGKSGTGKSTHSQLWLRHLESFNLLNDDNPIIRIAENEEVYIYGSPWSGKTPCYKNKKVQLKGLIRLRQEKYNNFQIKQNTESLVLLLPSCTAIRWNKKIFNHMVDTIQEVVSIVPIGIMDCLINKEAAEISYNSIKTNV